MKKLSIRYIFIAVFFGLFGASPAAAQAKYIWSGEWRVPSRFSPATLSIRDFNGKTFQFTIEAASGANLGEVAGVAVIRGNKAFFDDRESKPAEPEPFGCRLTFSHQGSFIDVSMNNECLNYAGSGVFFANKYYKGKPKVKESDFVVLEVFSEQSADAKFKTLTGRDYERFLDSFHQISEEEDLDGFGAKVFAGCVRGICPTMAGIIMHDANGRIWAAVLDDGAEGQVFANYYTNAAEWTGRLPQTIEKWVAEKRELNDALTVVYKNKR